MSNRFEENRAQRLVALLVDDLGLPARLAAPAVSLHNGCSDPGCCRPHAGVTGYDEPLTPPNQPMASVCGHGLSNRALSRLAAVADDRASVPRDPADVASGQRLLAQLRAQRPR